jgi:hypothetical protein
MNEEEDIVTTGESGMVAWIGDQWIPVEDLI